MTWLGMCALAVYAAVWTLLLVRLCGDVDAFETPRRCAITAALLAIWPISLPAAVLVGERR